MHNIAIAVVVGGFVLLGLAVFLRLRYGPRKLFGKYTSEIVCVLFLVLGFSNLSQWLRHEQHDAPSLVAAIGAFVACIAVFIELRRKRRAL